MNMADEIIKNYTNEELNKDNFFADLISDNDDFSRIFTIINIGHVDSCDEAKILINFLTDCSNPLREACAFKLQDVCPISEKYFLNEFSKNKFIKGIVDINPNVSRAVCSILSSSKEIAAYIEYDLILRIKNLIDEIKCYEKDNKDFFKGNGRNTKNHAKNKKLFALYWSLEALFFCFSGKYNSQVLEILNYTINFNDYTIREKTAQLLKKIDNPPLELLKKAKDDQNFYVKIQVYDKMTLKIS